MRKWIIQALEAILVKEQYSNLYLKHHLNRCPEKDRALATRIVYGTLQNWLYLNYVIDTYVKRKPKMKVRIILAMSMYQLFFLDKVPAYAVIDEAVTLTKKTDPKAAGMVNAVLHNALEKPVALPEDPWQRLSLQHSLPEWLLRMWKVQYGEDRAQMLARSANAIVPVIVRRNRLKSTPEEFKSPAFTCMEDPLYMYHGDSLAEDEKYLSGKLSAMDTGSYRIAELLDAKAGMHVLDTCSAPGTKAMAIAEMMHDTGEILCLDLHEHRVRLIESDRKRLGFTCIKAQCKDATDLEDLPLFDRVLCDVPCSGYGVLSRRPEIKIKMKPTDMDTLIPLQRKILQEAAKHVKAEGVLVYSTCTINKKENEKQVEVFLKEHPDFILEMQKTVFPDAQGGGFYMAKLVKKGSN